MDQDKGELPPAVVDLAWRSLDRVHEAVRFSEAKNGVVLTLSAGGVLACVTALQGTSFDGPVGRDLLYVAILGFMVSVLLSALSFLPQIRVRRAGTGGAKGRGLLHFYDLAKAPPGELGRLLRERYESADGSGLSQAYLDDIAEQLSANSTIAMRKLRIFSVSVATVIVSVLVLLSPTIGRAGEWVTQQGGAACRPTCLDGPVVRGAKDFLQQDRKDGGRGWD